MPMTLPRWPWLVLLGSFLFLHCAPQESALVVQVKDWPEGATRLRILPTFSDQAKPAFFVEPGVSEFAIYVPTGKPGRAVVEAMVEDSAGCYVAGQLTRAEFSEQAAIQRVDLALRPYESKQCPVTSFNALQQVSMDRRDNAWIVGDEGAALRWNGQGWFSTLAGRSEYVTSLWQSPTGELWVVGEKGLILRWDGSRWNQHPGGTSVFLTEIWGSGPEDVWAVGQQGTVLRFRGSQWESVVVPTLPNLGAVGFSDVWGSSPNDVWAVGNLGTIVHWDGTSWSPPQKPAKPPSDGDWARHSFTGVLGTSAENVFIIDGTTGGSILGLQGGEWVAEYSAPVGQGLLSLWAPTPDSLWVAGTNYLYRRQGASWLFDTQFPGTSSAWNGLAGLGPFSAIAVGTSIVTPTVGVVRYWNGTAWSATPNF